MCYHILPVYNSYAPGELSPEHLSLFRSYLLSTIESGPSITMSAALPPMHAALSVLGTMAGQYLASQQAQAAQAQPAQAQQPAPSTSQAAQTNATGNLCDVCIK